MHHQGWRCRSILSPVMPVQTASAYLVAQSCLTLCDPMDCSPPGLSARGSLQARILEWVAISFSRGSSWPRDRTHISCTGRQILSFWITREAHNTRTSNPNTRKSPTFLCHTTWPSWKGGKEQGRMKSREKLLIQWLARVWGQFSEWWLESACPGSLEGHPRPTPTTYGGWCGWGPTTGSGPVPSLRTYWPGRTWTWKEVGRGWLLSTPWGLATGRGRDCGVGGWTGTCGRWKSRWPQWVGWQGGVLATGCCWTLHRHHLPPGLLPPLRHLLHKALRAVPLGAPLFLCCMYYTHSWFAGYWPICPPCIFAFLYS